MSAARLSLLLLLALLAGLAAGWAAATRTAAGSRAASVAARAVAAEPGPGATGAPASLRDAGALSDAGLARVALPPRTEPAARGARPDAGASAATESALLLRIGALEAELADLRAELAVERAHDGTALESFRRTPDAETLTAREREGVELLLEYLPVHLFAGEPTWIVANALRPTAAGTWDVDDAAVIGFLGRERVLRQLGLRQLAEAWDTIGGELPAALGMTREEAAALREEIRAAGIEPRMAFSFGDEDL